MSPDWCPNCGSPRAETIPPEDPFLRSDPRVRRAARSRSQRCRTRSPRRSSPAAGCRSSSTASATQPVRRAGSGRPRWTALIDWLAARSANGTGIRTMREVIDPVCGSAPPPSPRHRDHGRAERDGGSSTASFDFSSTPAGASFECKLDSGASRPARRRRPTRAWATGRTHSRFGRRTARAASTRRRRRARGRSTRRPRTPRSRPARAGRWRRPPRLVRASPRRAGASFECKLDSGRLGACTSPKPYSGLADGSHTFSVRAKTARATSTRRPATRTWTVDTAAPGHLDHQRAERDGRRRAPRRSGSRATSGRVVRVQARRGRVGRVHLAEGLLRARERLAHLLGPREGRRGQRRRDPRHAHLDVDRIAPNTSITSGPSGTVSVTTATFTFTSIEAGSTFECRLDGSAWTACTSPKSYTSTRRGSHTFSVRARDAAGTWTPRPPTGRGGAQERVG